jgi:glycosyltransferase involved in cell wall biosynthesis
MRSLTDKINVLFVIMQMEMGGSERLVHNLALKLDRGLFNPSVAWFFGDRILKEFNDLNIPLYHVPKIRRIDLSSMRKLGAIVKDNVIHIVNAHHFMSVVYSFYGCKIRNHAGLVYTEHSEWEVERIPLKWRIMGNCLLKHADGAIGVSPAVTMQIKNKFKIDKSKTLTISNGVDLEAFEGENERQTLRKKLGIADNEKIIGTVANFRKIKNHIFLLKVFNEFVREYKNVRLLLIGQGFEGDVENTEEELRNYVNEKGLGKNVLFLGYRSDIPELLKIMDIFCLASFKEGLPISLIEAMAAGLPVVGTDVEGIRDVIIPNKNGFLVQIDDVKGLKNVLQNLIKDESLRNKFGEESKSLARDTYSLEHCVKQYQDIFSSIIKK